jgi:hypothetical protein
VWFRLDGEKVARAVPLVAVTIETAAVEMLVALAFVLHDMKGVCPVMSEAVAPSVNVISTWN